MENKTWNDQRVPFLVVVDCIIMPMVKIIDFSVIGSFLATVQQMHVNVHLWNKSATDAAPGNEVSNRKPFIIIINYVCNLHRPAPMHSLKKNLAWKF